MVYYDIIETEENISSILKLKCFRFYSTIYIVTRGLDRVNSCTIGSHNIINILIFDRKWICNGFDVNKAKYGVCSHSMNFVLYFSRQKSYFEHFRSYHPADRLGGKLLWLRQEKTGQKLQELSYTLTGRCIQARA